MVEKVIATAAAVELIELLKSKHGPGLMFHQSGGCCDNSAANCYLLGELTIGAGDVYLGDIGEKVNALGIGAQGLGGLTTVLDIKIKMYPTHAASKPVAMIPNCAATRHAHFVMDGSGPVYLDPPSLDTWPDVAWTPDYVKSKKVDLNTLTPAEVASWTPGQTLLLNGKMLTGRDAAHKRIQQMLAKGEKLPVDFTNRVIYYVGPVDPVKGEAVGPAGPTTATRMDGFTEMMLAQTGLISMVGKAERGPEGIEAIKKHQSALNREEQ